MKHLPSLYSIAKNYDKKINHIVDKSVRRIVKHRRAKLAKLMMQDRIAYNEPQQVLPGFKMTEGLSDKYNYRMYEVRVERVLKDNSQKRMAIHNAEDAAKLFSDLKTKDREYLVRADLDVKNAVISSEIVAVGTLSSNLVHPREVLKGAIISGAAGFVIAHNHPSGDPSPSDNDIQITRDLKKAAKLMNIELVDHVIIGQDKYYSLAEANKI